MLGGGESPPQPSTAQITSRKGNPPINCTHASSSRTLEAATCFPAPPPSSPNLWYARRPACPTVLSRPSETDLFLILFILCRAQIRPLSGSRHVVQRGCLHLRRPHPPRRRHPNHRTSSHPVSSFFARLVGRGMIFAPSELQADKISTIVKAANVNVESYWPGLFAKLLDTRSVDDLVLSVGSGIHIAPSRIALSCVNCFHIFVDA
jgi:hypothetical protein